MHCSAFAPTGSRWPKRKGDHMKPRLLFVAAMVLTALVNSFAQDTVKKTEKAVQDTAHAAKNAAKKTAQETEKAADTARTETKKAGKATADTTGKVIDKTKTAAKDAGHSASKAADKV